MYMLAHKLSKRKTIEIKNLEDSKVCELICEVSVHSVMTLVVRVQGNIMQCKVNPSHHTPSKR